MISLKNRVITGVKTIIGARGPLSYAFHVAHLRAQIAIGEEDIKNGRVMTVEESKAEMEALYESYKIAKSS